LWILDEPFTALDRAGVVLTESLIDTHLESGGLVVLSSHQPLSTRAVARRLGL
jgi:heme exporter protein A